jgi:hypothetical protein
MKNKLIRRVLSDVGKYCLISIVVYFIGIFFERTEFKKILPLSFRQIKDYTLEEKLNKSMEEGKFIRQLDKSYFNPTYDVKIRVQEGIPFTALESFDENDILNYSYYEALWEKIPVMHKEYEFFCNDLNRKYFGLNFEIERGYTLISIHVNDVYIYGKMFFFSDFGRILLPLPIKTINENEQHYYININSTDYKVLKILNDSGIIINFIEIIGHICYSPLLKEKKFSLNNIDLFTEEISVIEQMSNKLQEELIFKYFKIKYINCKDKKFKNHEKCQKI